MDGLDSDNEELPRPPSISPNDNFYETPQFYVRSEDSASTVRPCRSESVFSSETSQEHHFEQCEQVISSYKHIKRGLIVVCVFNLTLFLFGMILVVILFVGSKTENSNLGNVRFHSHVQTPESHLYPGVNPQTNKQVIPTPEISRTSLRRTIQLKCADINRHLFDNGKRGSGNCSLEDIPRAAHEYINAEVRKIKDESDETKEKARKVCCATRPLLQMHGNSPILTTENGRIQRRMRNWKIATQQSFSDDKNSGEIVIPEEGSYFLYSRLELSGQNVDKNSHPVYQIVLKKNGITASGYTEKQVTRHKCPGDKKRHSVSMEGTFYLKKADKLRVVFKTPEGITATDHFVGIFRI